MNTNPENLNQKYARRARIKFLRNFPRGYQDPKYIAWEREYKWKAHKSWEKQLNRTQYQNLLSTGEYQRIADIAVKIESKTNLLFSFEKMAIRDAVKSGEGAQLFSEGLFQFLYGPLPLEDRFKNRAEALKKLPVVKTRVHTWPLQTVFGFIANPKQHIFLKPRVTQSAASVLSFPFRYNPKPNWETYKNVLDFATVIKKETGDWKPRDYIDLQSFIWVMGSDEY